MCLFILFVCLLLFFCLNKKKHFIDFVQLILFCNTLAITQKISNNNYIITTVIYLLYIISIRLFKNIIIKCIDLRAYKMGKFIIHLAVLCTLFAFLCLIFYNREQQRINMSPFLFYKSPLIESNGGCTFSVVPKVEV